MNGRWNNGAFQSVFQKYFPEVDFDDWQLILMNIDWLTDEHQVDVVDKTVELSKLKTFEKSLNSAWTAFQSLHPLTKNALERSFKDNCSISEASRILVPISNDDERDPLAVFDTAELLFRTLLGHVAGDDPDLALIPPTTRQGRKNCVKSANEAVEAMKPSSPQHRKHETWKKAILIARARQIWTKYKNKPPKKPSDGTPFFTFVSELISASEKDWDTESSFKAWSKLSKDMDTYGLNS
jgi:hypothetical protein